MKRLYIGFAFVIAQLPAYLQSAAAIAQDSTERVSVGQGGAQGNGDAFAVDRSAAGRFVAFHSFSNNLVPGDTNGNLDVFVRDRLNGTTSRVSVRTGGVQANAESFAPVISGSGRFVAFSSDATDLVPGDTNGQGDGFVRDLVNNTTKRVTVRLGGGQANGLSFILDISNSGPYVVFGSSATNLVAGDTNRVSDLFVRDRRTRAISRISVSSSGQQANGRSGDASISAAGRYVAFTSSASNLVAGETGAGVFVHDQATGSTRRVSISSTGVQANLLSFEPAVSADGRFVAFASDATNLVPGDTNSQRDVFLHDLQTGATTRISDGVGGSEPDGPSEEPSISAKGRYITFHSDAGNIVSGDGNGGVRDVFVHDRQMGTTSLVSVSSAGASGNSFSGFSVIADDGHDVVFASDATNLVPADTNGVSDLFVRNR